MNEMIKVLYIDNDGGGFSDRVEIPKGTTISQFVMDRKGGGAPNYKIRVNRETVDPGYELKENDKVSIVPKKVEGA